MNVVASIFLIPQSTKLGSFIKVLAPILLNFDWLIIQILRYPDAMTFTMYSTTWCGYCKRLKRQLNDLGITFEEVNIEEVPEAAALIETINNGNQVVPTLVFADGTSMTNPPAVEVQAKLATLT